MVKDFTGVFVRDLNEGSVVKGFDLRVYVDYV